MKPTRPRSADYNIISGTPKTVIPRIRHVLEYLRPGSVFFWDGDGAMTHEESMRSLRLMGEEVIPGNAGDSQRVGVARPLRGRPGHWQTHRERYTPGATSLGLGDPNAIGSGSRMSFLGKPEDTFTVSLESRSHSFFGDN